MLLELVLVHALCDTCIVFDIHFLITPVSYAHNDMVPNWTLWLYLLYFY